MAFSSLMEVLNQIIIARELNFIQEADYHTVRLEIEKISNKLNALRKSQLNN
jgi:four helix bundle protein